MSYCYTFSHELMRNGNGRERYPGQPEIMRYLNHVADRFDLKRDIRFNTRVVAAHYDEAANRWRVTHRTAARPIVGKVPDHRRRLPVHGERAEHSRASKDFTGDWYHTGQWPHEGVDFTGKRVGMIGTGSTGIQAAPVIAETGGAPDRVPAHGELQRACAQRAADAASSASYIKENAARSGAIMHATPNGHAFSIERALGRSTSPPRSARAIYEAAWEAAACSSAPRSATC